MSTTTITDLADVQPGDIVTWTLGGHEYSGPCYETRSAPGARFVSGLLLRYATGNPHNGLTFVRAERPAPEPPSEPGTVLLVHGIDGKALTTPRVAIVDADGNALFGLDDGPGSPEWRELDRITSWQAVDVTPRGEVLTRG